jgi:YggT family protein
LVTILLMIRFILKLYIYLIIIDAILTYFPQLSHHEWRKYLRMAADFTQKPLRKLLPPDMPFDPSPLIVIILLNLVMVLW